MESQPIAFQNTQRTISSPHGWRESVLRNLRDLEPTCREYFLRSDKELAVLILVATALLIPPMNYLDHYYYGLSHTYWEVSIFEAILVACSLSLIWVIQHTQNVAAYEYWLFGWSLFTSGAACLALLTQHNRVIENVLLGELLLIAIYILLANRIAFRTIPALLVTITSIVSLNSEYFTPFENKYMLSLSLLVINLIGFFAIAITNRFKRMVYEAQNSEREARQLFEKLAATDELTGILNRRSFMEQTQHEFARFKRFPSDLCLVVIDLDHFKMVNDQFGHLAGDEALRKFTSTVSSVKRSYDIFGRLGGEEFGLLLPETGLQNAEKFLARIQEVVRTLVIKSQRNEFCITFSAGLASAEQSDASMDDLLRRADEALYRAKFRGRDRMERGD